MIDRLIGFINKRKKLKELKALNTYYLTRMFDICYLLDIDKLDKIDRHLYKEELKVLVKAYDKNLKIIKGLENVNR
jgi:hypothetical protein